MKRIKPCVHCGIESWNGSRRCRACDQYFRRHGAERPLLVARCACGGPIHGRGLCHRCYERDWVRRKAAARRQAA